MVNLTNYEKDYIIELIYFYNFNRKRLIIDLICFLLISIFLFYLIILQKN